MMAPDKMLPTPQSILKNLELSRFAVFFVILVFLALSINGWILLSVLKLHSQTLVQQQNRQDSLRITYDIEQETAALSRMVRAYTTSANTRYLTYYYDIIDIRQGKKAPPEKYSNNYWAEVMAEERVHVMPKDKPGMSLLQRMKTYGFTDDEFLALDTILKSSQNLYNQDQIAFAATQGMYDPKTKQFIDEGLPQPQFANNFVYSRHYLQLESKLLQAVDFFTELTDQRTKMAVQQVSAQLSRSIYAAIIILAITIVIVVAAMGVIRKMVLAPMKDLTRNALSFGAGDYTIRTDTGQGVLELQALGQTFNSMADNIEEDIFHREKIQQKLEVATVKAEDSTRAKSLFLANMSHEIRTPMNAIVGMTYLVQNTELNSRQHDYVAKIQQAARSLLRIINDILDFSKIEAGKMELEIVAFRLDEIVDNTFALLRQRAEEKKLELLIHFQHADLTGDGGTFLGDPLRLEQILTNLIANAVKFTDKGSVTLTVEETSRSVDTSELQFHIEDTGIGMSSEQVGRLFQEFSQADGSTTRKHGGTGLGLSISKRLINLMGGEISVTSTQNVGTEFVFTISLPRSKKPVLSTSEQELQYAGKVGGEPNDQVPDLTGMQVLLVEDNEINQQIASEMLGCYGIDVDIAGNGQEALDRLRAKADNYYQVILMDIQMPVMDGYEATRKIRQQKEYASLPIIAMTAHAMQEEKQRCVAAGMNDHIAKPFEINVLLQTITAYFRVAPLRPLPANPLQNNRKSEFDNGLPQHIPGIDLAEGLRLCGGKVDLYRKVLDNYRHNYGKSATPLSPLLENGRWQELSIMIHTLKGVSGTIGAKQIQALCEQIEEDGMNDTNTLRTLIDQLDQKRTIIQAALAEYFDHQTAPPGTADTPADEQNGHKIIAELRYLLSEADGTTHDFWTNHASTMRQLLPSSAQKSISHAIEQFQFEEALSLLSSSVCE